MSENGTSFTIDLPVTGQAGIDAATAAMDVLATKLDSASKAVKAQNESYRQAESVADKAAKAYERLSIAAESKGGQWIERQAEAKKQADEARAALEGEALALDRLRASAARAEGDLKKFKAEQKATEEAAGKLESGLRQLGAGAAADTLGKIGSLKSGFADLRAALGTAAPYVAVSVALLAVAAAIVAVAAAAAAGVLKIAEWAVTLADTHRSAVLLLSGGFLQSSKAGEELYNTVTRLTKRLPATRDELTATAKGLAYFGVKGKDLESALERSAVWAARIKFGPDWEKQMLALPEQSKIFQQNIAGIFGGLKIEKLLESLQLMISLFDETTASGKAIKVVFESIFQPMIDGVSDAKFKIEAFFLHLEIWALTALIAIKPYGSTIVLLGEIFLVLAGILIGVVVVAFLALAAAVRNLVKHVKQLYDLGQDLVLGLVEGIKSGGGAVFEALKAIVVGAVDGVKGFLHIKSPSRLMADQVGEPIGVGTAIGVERATGRVQNAMENMVSPPATPEVATAAASGAGSSAKSGANVTGNTFVFHGVKDAEDAESKFGSLLTRLIEGDVAQLGAAAPA